MSNRLNHIHPHGDYYIKSGYITVPNLSLYQIILNYIKLLYHFLMYISMYNLKNNGIFLCKVWYVNLFTF